MGEKMRTIRLYRKDHILEVADSSEDIDALNSVTLIYDISFLVRSSGGWYDLYNEKGILVGFITDVENVEERW
jgi:hypothetical protein